MGGRFACGMGILFSTFGGDASSAITGRICFREYAPHKNIEQVIPYSHPDRLTLAASTG
jgi:hypothetical protein